MVKKLKRLDEPKRKWLIEHAGRGVDANTLFKLNITSNKPISNGEFLRIVKQDCPTVSFSVIELFIIFLQKIWVSTVNFLKLIT